MRTGQSRPACGLAVMNWVPSGGLPKISKTEGRSSMPALPASAAWSISWKNTMPLAAISFLRRATVSSTPYALLWAITPDVGLDTVTGFRPSAPPCEADDIIRAKASMAAEQAWEMQLGIGLSVERERISAWLHLGGAPPRAEMPLRHRLDGRELSTAPPASPRAR